MNRLINLYRCSSQKPLRPRSGGGEARGEVPAAWTTILPGHLAYLSQLCLQLVFHLRLLGDARVEGQVGADELPPQLVCQHIEEVLRLLPQPDGVGPHVLRVPDVVVTEFGPRLGYRDPGKVRRENLPDEEDGGAGGGLRQAWRSLHPGFLSLGALTFGSG